MTKPLRTADITELAKCAADPWYFITTYCHVLDPVLGVINFEPWPHLHELLDIVLRNDRVILLKSRQIGVSWLLVGLALHTSLFNPGAVVLIFSRRQVESIEMKERVKFMWRHLPDYMRQPVGKDNDEMLTFPTMDSKVISLPAVEGSGRTWGATLVIFDEWAYMPNAREIYTAAMPTVERSKMVGVSTANGRGNLFADLYHDAKLGKNSFIPVFIPFNARPGRTAEWWEQQKRDMPVYLALQEYPLLEVDAFMIAGTCMFDIEALRAMPISAPPPFTLFSTPAKVSLWRPYTDGHKYIAGIDTALGITGRDYNCLQIIDETTNEQAAKIRTPIPVEQFADAALRLLTLYQRPMVIIEEQPVGRLIFKVLKDARYPLQNIYHRAKGIPCWHTAEANRKTILSELEQGIRGRQLIIFSKETMEECLAFGYNEAKDKFEATSGHDDEVMSLALSWHVKVNKLPALTDFVAKSYLDVEGTIISESVEDINWGAANPLKNRTVTVCPECLGERMVVDQWGRREICPRCDGRASIITRQVHV
jgi:hypothetical protein